MSYLQSFFTNPAYLNTLLSILIILVAGVAFYFQSRAKAKQAILGIMLQTEKRAAQYLLSNGPDMFNFVTSRAYPLMPGVLRMLISYDAFKKLAQSLYDDAKIYLAKVIEQNPPTLATAGGPVVVQVGTLQDQGDPNTAVNITSPETAATGAPGGTAAPDPTQVQ